MGKKNKAKTRQSKNNREDIQSDSDNDSLGEDIFTDEISEFTEARNKIDLEHKDEESDAEEGLLGLVSDDEESDEEIGEWSKRLKQIKFQAKIDKRKIQPDAPEKSWGKRRTDFYGSGVRRKPKDAGTDEEDEWTMEEKEIEKLQKRLDEDLDEEDFLVPALAKKTKEKNDALKVTRELTDKEKEKYSKQIHPETEPLREELNCCLEKVQQLKTGRGWMRESRNTVYRLLGANIAFYLHLLETGQDTRGHPVLKKIIQWKKLAKIYDSIDDAGDDDDAEGSDDIVKERGIVEEDAMLLGEEDLTSAKRARLAVDDSENEDWSGEEKTETNNANGLQSENRPVTYEIEKNKAKRKTAPNNPRVKHREKFRKAKIRRKGKIRDYRPEVTKYQGEMSGIRSGIVRSIRLA